MYSWFSNPLGRCLISGRKLTKFTEYLTVLRRHFGFSTDRLKLRRETKGVAEALRVIELVCPEPSHSNNLQSHLKLLDLLQVEARHFTEQRPCSDIVLQDTDCIDLPDLERLFSSFEKDNPVLGVFGLHTEGLRNDVAAVSRALSASGCRGDLRGGTQVQCLAIKDGIFANVYIGSSLISMYSKCRDMHSACKVFEEMPFRNIVTWTGLLSGFSQECQVNVCFDLYNQMRTSTVIPNDFTISSLLTACVGSGSLQQGRNAHCQAVLWGVDSFVHVANALISMYSKCGHVEDASCVFKGVHEKDVVSWNSMIAGNSLQGRSQQTIDLFEEMRKSNIQPDGITFLGVLSSCRHVGLVDQGIKYFNLMLENDVTPDVGHYSCIVDLLGRAGMVEEARNFILRMPIEPNAVIWGSLLSSCRLHNRVWVGIEAAECRLALEPSCAATHLQLAKLYAKVGMWDKVAKVQKMMKSIQTKPNPGCSWIEIRNEVYIFKAADTSNHRISEIMLVLDGLMDHLTDAIHTPVLREGGHIGICTELLLY